MPTSNAALIARIIAFAKAAAEPDALAWDRVHDADTSLLEDAEEAFESWEQALGAALHHLAHQAPVAVSPRPSSKRVSASDSSSKRSSSRPPKALDEPEFERVAQTDQGGPILVRTTDNYLLHIEGNALETAFEVPATPVPLGDADNRHGIELVRANPEEDFVLALTASGILYPINGAAIPNIDSKLVRPSDISAMASDEKIAALLLRNDLRSGQRFVHVSTAGKVKATQVKEIGRNPDHSGTTALLLDEHDAIAAAFFQLDRNDAVFCANLSGNAIHFDLAEVRAMGLRARGVKAMAFDEFDSIADAFAVGRATQFIVLSASGLGKRVDLEEFRPQGRGGQGMILMRPPRGVADDEIAALIPIISRNDDIIVGTLGGTIARIAASAVPLMGRPQSGVPILEVEEGDRVYTACRMPGSGPQ